MTIQQYVKAGGIAVTAVIALAAVIAAWGINTIRFGGDMHHENQLFHEFNADILPPPAYLVEAFMEANLLASYPEEFTDHSERLKAREDEFHERVAYWEASDLDPELKSGLLATAARDGEQFWQEVDTVLRPAVRDGNEAAASRSIYRLLGIYRSHRAAIDQLVQNTAAQKAELEESSSTTLAWVGIVLTLSGLLIVGVVIVAIVLLSRKVLSPLGVTADTMKKMAAGNLEVGRVNSHRADEIGTMTQAIEVFRSASINQRDAAEKQQKVVDTLSDSLNRLAAGDMSHRINQSMGAEYEVLREAFNSSVDRLATMIGHVRDSASSVSAGSNEIRAASDDLAVRNERQAASLEETAAAMNQVTDLVRKSASNASEAQSSMSETHRQASNGGNVVKRAVEAMSSIEKSSQEITQIIDVIDGIAFQTNLLALNAGVEAARAGDAGKGFAVVANEVRALAQRSADAARDIKELIGNSTTHVGDGVSLVGETGDLLEAIVDRIAEVSNQVNNIAEMAATQAANLEQINTSVGEMDNMTQQNAAMVEQSTAAARSLADEAGELGRLVEKFHINAGGTVAPIQAPTRAVASSPPSRVAAAPPKPARPKPKAPVPAPAAPQTSGNLALSEDFDDQDWSEF